MSQVEELLQKENIKYRISGKDVLVRCLNPDHDDTNPSMRIDRILGVFNCFSCGFKGNVFKHYDAEISILGIQREKLKRKINELRTTGVGLRMPEGATPFHRDYRGISAETYSHFNAFWSFSSDYVGRINFPITDTSDRIVAFIGRDEAGTLDTKYKISPPGAKLPLFPKARPLQGRVILVEGIFDMLNLYDKGLTNAVCCFGVNRFDKDKFELLKISGVTGLDLMFDSDEAGKKASDSVKKVVGDFHVRTINLKSGDPGDLTQRQVDGLKKKLYLTN